MTVYPAEDLFTGPHNRVQWKNVKEVIHMLKILNKAIKIIIAVTGVYIIMNLPEIIGISGSDIFAGSPINDVYTFAEDKAENIIPDQLKNLIENLYDKIEKVSNVIR